jgi:hypothetical protein
MRNPHAFGSLAQHSGDFVLPDLLSTRSRAGNDAVFFGKMVRVKFNVAVAKLALADDVARHRLIARLIHAFK